MIAEILIKLGFLFLFAVVFSSAWAAFSAAPWVPARKKELARVLDGLDLSHCRKAVDLGCGDGRWVFALAKLTRAEIIGYEISVFWYLFCRIKKLFGNYPHLKFKYKNLYQADLSQVDLVICFLMTKSLAKLESKFQSELPPGAQVISYSFKLPTKTAEKTLKIDEKSLPIYFYRF